MKAHIAVIAVSIFSLSALAQEGNDFKQTTDKALAAGSPDAVVKALERESYRGNLIAALELGLMYRDGRTIAADPAKAKKYLKVAASTNLNRIWFRHGVPEAQYALAQLYQAGAGGKADPSEAESWYSEAAEMGEVRSQLALAKMYFEGAGIKRDTERAFFWASVAASSLPEGEQKDAEQLRDRLAQQLEPTRLAKLKSRLETWKAKRV